MVFEQFLIVRKVRHSSKALLLVRKVLVASGDRVDLIAGPKGVGALRSFNWGLRKSHYLKRDTTQEAACLLTVTMKSSLIRRHCAVADGVATAIQLSAC